MDVVPIETDKMLGDLFTKSLPQPAFEKFIRIIMNLGDRSLRMSTSSRTDQSTEATARTRSQGRVSAATAAAFQD